jgi:hypothetical protein
MLYLPFLGEPLIKYGAPINFFNKFINNWKKLKQSPLKLGLNCNPHIFFKGKMSTLLKKSDLLNMLTMLVLGALPYNASNALHVATSQFICIHKFDIYMM